MDLLALRNLISNALTSKVRGLANQEIREVEYVNPLDAGGVWALRVTVDDGVGGTRVLRVAFTEE